MRAMTFRDYNWEDENQWRYWGKSEGLRPFWALVNDRSITQSELPNEILKWKNSAIQALLEWREPVTRVQRYNRMLYKAGFSWSRSDDIAGEQNRANPRRRRGSSKNYARIVVPYLYTATEQHVSDLSSYEPELAVMSTKNEEIAKVAAHACKDVLDYYFYEQSLKVKFQRFHRRKKIDGETYYMALWNPDAGDLHPSYVKYRQMQRDMGIEPDAPIPLVGDNGAPIEGEDGPLYIERPVKTGDMMLRMEFAERILYPIPDTYVWDDVPFIFNCPIWMDVDEVRARWPKKADDIKADQFFSSFLSMKAPALSNKVAVRYMWHPPSTFLDRGYYCVSTESTFLEGGDYPFKHGKLPCIRGTDIDIENEIHGMSMFQMLASLAGAVNESTSMILQNQELFARPKMQVPRGAKIKRLDLDDNRGMYEYSGPKGAEIISVNSTPADTFKWREIMRDEFQTHSAIFATSRGQGVDGITANVALRLIDEQERKLHKPAIDKHAQNCIDLGTLILSLLGTYRDPSDGMLIKILGRNNERQVKAFDVANLSSAWEVQLAKTSALPQSPAAKSQLILDYAEQFPELWTPEEILEQLDMPRPERLVESATLARESAESEVEDILQGYDVPPPTQYHDILPKYRVYAKAVQGRSFDDKPPQIKARMINMIVTSEYLIMKKSKLNPMFQQKVLTEYPFFPMFFPMPKQEISQYQLAVGAQPMMAMAPGVNAPPLGGLPPEIKAGAPTPPEQPTPPETQTPPSAGATLPPKEQPPVPDSGAGSNLP